MAATPFGLQAGRHQVRFACQVSSKANEALQIEGKSNDDFTQDGLNSSRRSYAGVIRRSDAGFLPRNSKDSREAYLEKIRGEQPEYIDVESLPEPVMEGAMPTVFLKKKALNRGRKFCEFALIGRIDFGRVSVARVREFATKIWAPFGDWRLIPLGNGYFMLKLESKDDMVRIWSQVWRVENQIIGFNKWSPDFDPGKQRSTNMLLWVRFPFLQQQYWD